MTETPSVVKLRLEPDKETSDILDGQSRICNWLYNHLLQKANDLRKEYIKTQDREVGKKLYTERGLRNLIPKIKEERPFIKVVHSSPLKNVALRLSNSIRTYQRTKKGHSKRSGWPRFHAWKEHWFSLLYDEPNKGFKITGNDLILSLGMGKDRKRRQICVRIRDVQTLKGKTIRNLRIVKQMGVFYAIFTVTTPLPSRKPISRIIAIDPNHKNLGYGVDTNGNSIEIAAPTWLKRSEKRIDELKSKRDRCKKRSRQVDVTNNGEVTGKRWEPSKRWKRYQAALDNVYRKRREQTKTFLYTLAHRLFHNYDCVAVGDYTPYGQGTTSKMRRAMNNESLIGRWKQVLFWVAQRSGKFFMEYDERNTTRSCYQCGYVLETGLDPSIRTWICPACQTEHIRDENAAQNGLRKILRDFSEKNLVPGSGLVPIQERWAWRVWPSGILMSRGSNSELFAAPGN